MSSSWIGRFVSRSSLLVGEVMGDAILWMGKRDSRTLKGKIFKGSFGLRRPKKRSANPYAVPPSQGKPSIPQQLRPHPLLPSGAAALA
ncbi:hypothetical protein Ndes2437B_g03687 [Nannochloris sp. 'desiccata']